MDERPIAVAGIAFLALSIFCHVAGNCLGMRLREIGDQPQFPADQSPRPRGRATPQDFAPVTRLGSRHSLGWTIIVASSIGVTSGAIGGGLWTFLAGHGHVGIEHIAIGVIAFAFLGGMAAFATVAFTQVLCGAIWQALHGPPASTNIPISRRATEARSERG